MAHILLIESNAEHAKLVRERLKARLSPVTVTVASSGTKGLSLLSRKKYDCILTDYSLPDLSGTALIKRLSGLSDKTPLIVLTGRGDEKTGSEAIRLGATDYILKSKTSLDMIPDLVSKRILKAHKIGKVLEEVEKMISQELQKIRKRAEKILRG